MAPFNAKVTTIDVFGRGIDVHHGSCDYLG
jgi:hypothetical protein